MRRVNVGETDSAGRRGTSNVVGLIGANVITVPVVNAESSLSRIIFRLLTGIKYLKYLRQQLCHSNQIFRKKKRKNPHLISLTRCIYICPITTLAGSSAAEETNSGSHCSGFMLFKQE